MGFRLQLDFLAKQHMTAANLSSIEAAPFAVDRLMERLSASYAAHCETPSGGGKSKLLTAALMSHHFALVRASQAYFCPLRAKRVGCRQCFEPPYPILWNRISSRVD